jgi:hypothetical protein
MDQPSLPTNRLAIFSITAAVLTVLSFCGGVAPIPLTGWICYPAAILLGAIALTSGISALNGIRRSGEAGRGMALAGVWIGGLTILATVLAVFLTAAALVVLVQQLWAHFHP